MFDPHVGVHPEDLGELIFQYNEVCNNFPMYEVSVGDFVSSDVVLVHGVAGFLGVFGNLATCTVCHGYVLSQFCDHVNELGCAGDDAVIATENHFEVVPAIETLGILQRDKVFSSMEAAIYLKRKFKQVHCSGLVFDFVIWPSLAWLNVQDPRWSYLSNVSFLQRRQAIASSVFSCIRKILFLDSVDPDKAFVHLATFLFHHFYTLFNLPITGNLPQCGGDSALGIVADISDDWWNLDPLERVIRRHYTGSCRVTRRERIVALTEDGDWHRGLGFMGNMNKFRSYAERVGWLRSEKIFELVVGYEGILRLRREFDGSNDIPIVYEFSVEEDIPGAIAVADDMQELPTW